MKTVKVAVIGGGAAGMMAAITAADHGAEVTIFEKNDRLGKKILATGNGKCNLSNTAMSEKAYHSDDSGLVRRCLERFGVKETVSFFEGLGLLIRDKNGYLYPYGEQASAVLDVLRLAVERKGISVVYEASVDHVEKKQAGYFVVISKGKQLGIFDRVIVAGGSKAAPKTGSDGSCYRMAKQLGLQVTEIYPALVQLKCKEDCCKALAGVRAEAAVHMYVKEKEVCREVGEVQFTDYGISGIPVFQLSGQANQLLEKEKKLSFRIDFFPEYTEEAWKKFCAGRLNRAQTNQELTVEAFFTGILNKKVMTVLIKNVGLKMNAPLKEVSAENLYKVLMQCRDLRLHVIGSNSFENAQVCTGGISMKQLTENLEAKKVSGLYFAGEVLHVDGRCGGYNLQWAWTSGYLAGKNAAGKLAVGKREHH